MPSPIALLRLRGRAALPPAALGRPRRASRIRLTAPAPSPVLARAGAASGLAAALILGGSATLGLLTREAAAHPASDLPIFTLDALPKLEQGMDGAMIALAERALKAPRPGMEDRPAGWSVLDLTDTPSLKLGALTPAEAQELNAFLPATADSGPPADPFHISGSPAEKARAELCLSQAVYYEAATEPLAGQEAVAQTVINRMRNPAFPKSICGVVYQGSQQVTGCQYSFTCDGSRQREPAAPYWQQAQAVAERALNGFVMTQVGRATHYHADYVFPRWGPTLVKLGQIGRHIFYRFPGPLGAPESFREGYRGGETKVSMAGPSPAAILAAAQARAAAVASGQEADDSDADALPAVATPVSFPYPAEGGANRKRVAGEIVFDRRVPTSAEVAKINASLAAMEAGGGAARPAELPARPVAQKLAALPAHVGPASVAPLPARPAAAAYGSSGPAKPAGAAPASAKMLAPAPAKAATAPATPAAPAAPQPKAAG